MLAVLADIALVVPTAFAFDPTGPAHLDDSRFSHLSLPQHYRVCPQEPQVRPCDLVLVEEVEVGVQDAGEGGPSSFSFGLTCQLGFRPDGGEPFARDREGQTVELRV